jgi:putative NIF3 family GTP cyclohydrolase 1 type 2
VSGKMADKLGVKEYRILSESQDNVGLGVIGQLPEPMGMQEFVAHVAKVFGIEGAGLRYVNGKSKQVQNIAICGGAGADLVNEAMDQGADAYVSADFKYHEMQAAAGQIAVVDMDHWVSEYFTREIFEQLLSPYIHTHVAKTDKSPVRYWRVGCKV